MNYKFLVACLVYLLTASIVEFSLFQLTFNSAFKVLFIAHTIALFASWMIYTVIRKPNELPTAPQNKAEWAITGLGLITSGLVTFGTLLFVVRWLHGMNNGVMDIFVILPLMVLSTIIVPVMYWAVYRATGLLFERRSRPVLKSKNIQKTKGMFASGLVAGNVVAVPLYVFALFLASQDVMGFSFIYTLPIYLLAIIIFVPSSIYFVLQSFKFGKTETKKMVVYRTYALAAFFAVLMPVAVYLTNLYVIEAAKKRAESPIELSEARELIDSCKVETLYREYDGARMSLHEKGFYLPMPAMTAPTERRTFDTDHFDEILNLALSANVQSRCGFVPFYDIEHTKKPNNPRWITLTEAEGILKVCANKVELDIVNGSYAMILPPNAGDGIQLIERHEVWNHEIVSRITPMGVDGTIAQKLKTFRQNCK